MYETCVSICSIQKNVCIAVYSIFYNKTTTHLCHANFERVGRCGRGRGRERPIRM